MTSSSDLEVGPTTTEPRCEGHYVGTGYSHYGLARNCPHAGCKAIARKHGWTPEQFAARIERGLR